MFNAASLTVAKIWRRPTRPSKDEQVKKLGIYTLEHDSAIKKNDFTYTQNLRNPIKEQAEQKHAHSHREYFDCRPGGRGVLGGKGEGSEKHRLAVTEQPREVKYSPGNRVNNIVITPGHQVQPGLSGDHFTSYIKVSPLGLYPRN